MFSVNKFCKSMQDTCPASCRIRLRRIMDKTCKALQTLCRRFTPSFPFV